MLDVAEKDATAATLFPADPPPEKDLLEKIHDGLMVAGMAPLVGNVADAADALLFAYEGEFGDAAISAAAMIPFLGQAVSAKKALKVAKESGDEMLTFYRGVEKWYPGEMVKDGMFISPGTFSERMTKEGLKKVLYGTADIKTAKKYGDVVLEFEVPSSWALERGKMKGPSSVPPWDISFDPDKLTNIDLKSWGSKNIIFEDGLPKEFLKKVHK